MPRTPCLTIGALAERTGCNPPTIRYYEEIGLLPRPGRRASGHRTYGDEDLRRLTFVRRCRDFGFPVEQVRALVALTEASDRDRAGARNVAQAHLDAVREKLVELQELERTLVSFVDSCNTACAGGLATQCAILEDLATPAPQRTSCFG